MTVTGDSAENLDQDRAAQNLSPDLAAQNVRSDLGPILSESLAKPYEMKTLLGFIGTGFQPSEPFRFSFSC